MYRNRTRWTFSDRQLSGNEEPSRQTPGGLSLRACRADIGSASHLSRGIARLLGQRLRPPKILGELATDHAGTVSTDLHPPLDRPN